MTPKLRGAGPRWGGAERTRTKYTAPKLPWPISRRSEKSFSGSSLKKRSAISGSLRLPARLVEGMLGRGRRRGRRGLSGPATATVLRQPPPMAHLQEGGLVRISTWGKRQGGGIKPCYNLLLSIPLHHIPFRNIPVYCITMHFTHHILFHSSTHILFHSIHTCYSIPFITRFHFLIAA